jgi:hypothetical protein
MTNSDFPAALDLPACERVVAEARQVRAQYLAAQLRRGASALRVFVRQVGGGTAEHLRRFRTTYAGTGYS